VSNDRALAKKSGGPAFFGGRAALRGLSMKAPVQKTKTKQNKTKTNQGAYQDHQGSRGGAV
jgi:hypothetical protein